MAKKAELLEQAKKLKLEVSNQNTIAEIEAAIKNAGDLKPEVAKKVANIMHETIAGEEPEMEEVAKVTKAGKHSEKAIKEAEEKAEKQERKGKSEDNLAKKGPKPVARPKAERRGKKYQEVAKLVDRTKTYSLSEALELATKTSPTKFDASVEIHVKLGVDPRQADQNIRSTVSLPKGTGKTIKVAVFAPESEHKAAQQAGADIVGDEDFLQKLDKNELGFDILITTPQYMPKLGKYARVLGPKGLMPNPKSGTVATNLVKAIEEAKAGKVEYRVDKQAIIHVAIGKVSFGAKNLEENAAAFFESLKSQRPASMKGVFIKSIFICSTMGPSLKVENNIN